MTNLINQNMELPVSIEPCPVLEALFEIRFIANINANAVFGIIYNVLQKEFEKVESLPILQLPDIVRANDPNFKYKPYYQISNNDFVVQIGPDVISISSFPKYAGWNLFSQNIFNIISNVEEVGIINKIERIGIRYVNFFENNVFEKINLQLLFGNENIINKNTIIRTEIEQGSFISTLQITNNAMNNDRIGSIIDIDTFTFTDLDSFFEMKTKIINESHSKEKELFFVLLKKEFLETLNPKY